MTKIKYKFFCIPIVVFGFFIMTATCQTQKNDDNETDFLTAAEEWIEPINKDAKIAIVTHYTKNLDYIEFTLKNHLSYAQAHNYAYYRRNGRISGEQFQSLTDDNPKIKYGIYWQKIRAVQDAITEKNEQGKMRHEWVIWVDADVLFTNPSIKIEDKIKEIELKYGNGKEFIVAPDIQPNFFKVNSGVFLVKNTPFGRALIQSIANRHDQYKNNGMPEQEAMQDLIFNKPWAATTKQDFSQFHVQDIDNRIAYVEQRSINSFDGNFDTPYYGQVWQPCDFIVHPCGAKNKYEFIKKRIETMDPTKCKPVKEYAVFADIYKNGTWGRDEKGKGTSGPGSSPQEAESYINYVNNFLHTHEVQSVVDIGCGDGQLLRLLDLADRAYVCYELVEMLVNDRKQEWVSSNKAFIYKSALDLTEADLPAKKEVVLIKDVLQHLSNEQIFNIFTKIREFKFAIIVNDIDLENKDNNNFNIQTGLWRPLDLTAYPFNVVIKEKMRYQAHGNTKEIVLLEPSKIYPHIALFLKAM